MEKAVEALYVLMFAAVCGSIPFAGIGAFLRGRRGAVTGAIIGAIVGPIAVLVFVYLAIQGIGRIAPFS